MSAAESTPHKLPRVAISYCTQCRWLLRAAYFGQELLSTFSTAIGEVALIPATGGLFSVTLTYEATASSGQGTQVREVLLWDRKSEGGFPETKVLKQRVRDYIEPERHLGHSDKKEAAPVTKDADEPQRTSASAEVSQTETNQAQTPDLTQKKDECEDCK